MISALNKLISVDVNINCSNIDYQRIRIHHRVFITNPYTNPLEIDDTSITILF